MSERTLRGSITAGGGGRQHSESALLDVRLLSYRLVLWHQTLMGPYWQQGILGTLGRKQGAASEARFWTGESDLAKLPEPQGWQQPP